MGPVSKKVFSFLSVFLCIWLFARYLLPIFFPFLLGLGLAFTAEPMVEFFSKKLRFPRPLAAGLGVSGAFCFLMLLLALICAFFVRELRYLAGVLPALEQTARSGIAFLENWLLGLADRAPGSIGTPLQANIRDLFSGGTALLDKAVRYLLGLAGTLLTRVPDSALTLGTAILSGFMISAKLPGLRTYCRQHFPREKLKPLWDTLKRTKTALAGWLLAQLKLSAVTLLLLSGGLLLLRIPYGLLWALGISVLDAFPVLGTGTVLLPWALICFLQGDGARAIGLLGIYTAISLTRSLLEPKLVGNQLGLDPLVTLMALYTGYKIWGLGGMILAPLITATALQIVPEKGK